MSTLLADTIRKTGGTAGVDIRVKNTSVYESDGGTSVTQNIVQSLCKAWQQSDIDTENEFRDSFNHASLTDNGTGDVTYTFTNAMANAFYASSGLNGNDADSAAMSANRPIAMAAGTIRIKSHFINADPTYSAYDADAIQTAIHGDLA